MKFGRVMEAKVISICPFRALIKGFDDKCVKYTIYVYEHLERVIGRGALGFCSWKDVLQYGSVFYDKPKKFDDIFIEDIIKEFKL